MAKRMNLSERRAGDARGIDAIFQDCPSQDRATTEAVAPETHAPAKRVEDEMPASPAKPVLSKVTLYIRPEQVIAVETIQLAERQRTGKKPDKSDLIQEALDLLVEKYRSP